MPIATAKNKIRGAVNEEREAYKRIYPTASKKEGVEMMHLITFCDSIIALKSHCSRVHITSVTLAHLNGAYKVEDGDGDVRDPYLKEHNVKTYFVINPKVSSTFILWPVIVVSEQDQ